MYDPAIARFTGVDPIADQFPWVSTYNYAENEPIAHIDLWGLQAVLAVTIGSDVRYRGSRFTQGVQGSSHTHLSNNSTATSGLVQTLKEASSNDPQGVGFVALWSHGLPGEAFGRDAGSGGIINNQLTDLEMAVNNGEISFAEGAIIYLGACNAGTDCEGGSLAQNIANVTGAEVVAAVNDQVGPLDESNGTLEYTTAYPRENSFHSFTPNNSSQALGSKMNIFSLQNRANSQIGTAREAARINSIKAERQRNTVVRPLETLSPQSIQSNQNN